MASIIPSIPSKTRLSQLAQLSAKIFNNVYNPTGERTGNKILRKRLIGSTVTGWYPHRIITLRKITDTFPGMKLVNQEEKLRLEEIAKRKKRGKGAPKKGQGKRASLGTKKQK
ncbi:mitochondrial ribosomal subunit S27-domain-containing protein [Rhizophagus diaphanus]|nr:mitochondrial ribosomal subunit S27-domain-containing protein [Rhizophagus diaphanus] [Rhizophagus sp. MUCL 43196]